MGPPRVEVLSLASVQHGHTLECLDPLQERAAFATPPHLILPLPKAVLA